MACLTPRVADCSVPDAAHRTGSSATGRSAAALLGVALLLGGCADPGAEIAELAGSTMGTTYSVRLSPAPDAAARARLEQQIEERLDAVNRVMSTYQDDSDLMRFNHAAGGSWQTVPLALVELVERAAAISRQTDGIYDVTVGPLVNLWGFGRDGRRDTPPQAAEIDAVLADVGFGQVESRRSPPALRKARDGVQIDLSSIAKGWAVDEIGRLLRQAGFANHLVEIGGELRASGAKSNGEPWRIAIEKPIAGRRDVQRVVALRDVAMATSGDYRNFFSAGGRRYSHTIDPRSGRTVAHRLASVTVFAASCTDADAWATALMAAGDAQGPALAAAHDLRALFVIREGDSLVERISPALAASGLLGTE